MPEAEQALAEVQAIAEQVRKTAETYSHHGGNDDDGLLRTQLIVTAILTQLSSEQRQAVLASLKEWA